LLERIEENRGILYGQKRFLLDVPFKNFTAERSWDLNAVLNAFYFRIYKKLNTRLFYTHTQFNLSKAQIFHFYNSVTQCNKPWVTTLETPLTSFMQNGYDPFRYVIKNNCKRILCMSSFTYNNTLRMIDNEDVREVIQNKMQVLPPPQQLLIPSSKPFIDTTPLKFVIVGNEFFRKGGYEILLAFDRLLNENRHLELNIVSSMELGDYPVNTDPHIREAAFKIIHRHPQEILYHHHLPNSDTLEVIKSCHIGLLPSLLETYGYAVLEYMAAGLPVITTNQRAFLEINNELRGWFINLPAENGYLLRDTAEKRKSLSDVLTASLYDTIKSISDGEQSEILRKSANAWMYINEQHNPDKYAQILEEIYFEALQN
jgi:glycosyltransferase involved in cell wall biosynthesis